MPFGSASKVLLSLVFLGGALLFTFHNCGPVHITHQSFPPIGEEVTLPVMGSVAQEKGAEAVHTLVFVQAAGRELREDEGYRIHFYTQSDEGEELLWDLSLTELREMFFSTSCPQRLKKYLENAFGGDGLFCNSSFDETLISRVEAVSEVPGVRPREATSAQVEFVNQGDQVVAISYLLE